MMVRESPYNALLREWQRRPRTMGRDVASHPITIRRIMETLDANGPSEAGDCIHSLVFELQIAMNRAQRFADELMKYKSAMNEIRALVVDLRRYDELTTDTKMFSGINHGKAVDHLRNCCFRPLCGDLYSCSEPSDSSGGYYQSADVDNQLRPIDTAPKDGSVFLATDGDKWSDANSPPGFALGRWRYHNGIKKWVGESLQFKATHWIPVPPFSS